MLQIDLSKAFDSISFEFIENTLKIFNPSPTYKSWINSLLKNFESSILINVGRGCRQGDSIAGYLFIKCVELLLLKLHNCKDITPWSTTSHHQKLLDAYADDINLFLAYNHPTQQLNHILDTLNKFKALSGLTANVSKTKYAIFGNAPDDQLITPTTGISIENTPFRLLGITLTGDLKNLDINWHKAIKSVRHEIFQWSTIKLTTTAKVNITKTCFLSKFTHLATALPLPKKIPILRKIIFTPKKYGGLGIPDLRFFWSSLQCSWLKRLHSSKELWAKILLNQDTPIPMAFLTHRTVALSLRLSNPFWTLVLERWKTLSTNLYSVSTNLIHTNICHSNSTNFPLSIPPTNMSHST